MAIDPFLRSALVSARIDFERGWIDAAGYERRIEVAIEGARRALDFPKPFTVRDMDRIDAAIALGETDIDAALDILEEYRA